MNNKMKVGVIGATGMVGQRFLTLLNNHPWFEVGLVAASPASAGKPYAEAVAGRWVMATPIPDAIGNMTVEDGNNVKAVSSQVRLVFCAVDMKPEEIRDLETRLAKSEVMVVSANSAHRWTEYVPMIIPEVNGHHLQIIPVQRQRLGISRGGIVVKPNCSLLTFVPPLHHLSGLGIMIVAVATYQAVSGAGQTLEGWPEMTDNVIPFIKGEEEKTAREPRKIWGSVAHGKIELAGEHHPLITSQCFRVPVSDGHMAAVWVRLERVPEPEEIIALWNEGEASALWKMGLPSAPHRDVCYIPGENRPQTKLDRDTGGGMTTCVGRLRRDPTELFDFMFVGLSHNTIRGAAGGAILTAELMKHDGYLG